MIFSRMTFSRMTFSRMTFSRMTFNRMTFTRMIFNKMTFTRMIFNKMTFSRMTLSFGLITFYKMTFNIITFYKIPFSIMTLNRMTLSWMTFNPMTLFIGPDKHDCVFCYSADCYSVEGHSYGCCGTPGRPMPHCCVSLSFILTHLYLRREHKTAKYIGNLRWVRQYKVLDFYCLIDISLK